MAPSFCPFLHFSWSSAEQMEWSNKLYIDVKLYNLCITEAYPLLRPACQRAAGHGGPAQLWSVCQDEGWHYRRPETGRAQGGGVEIYIFETPTTSWYFFGWSQSPSFVSVKIPTVVKKKKSQTLLILELTLFYNH